MTWPAQRWWESWDPDHQTPRLFYDVDTFEPVSEPLDPREVLVAVKPEGKSREGREMKERIGWGHPRATGWLLVGGLAVAVGIFLLQLAALATVVYVLVKVASWAWGG